jgi:hypothetical protein
MADLVPFAITYVVSLAVLIGVAYYANRHKRKLDEMHGMMVGMTFGMTAGLLTSTLYLIPTGEFLNGVIFGSIAGLVFGLPFGRFGGHLGVMEGIVAGPMGGMMGAMLGQMVRPFDIELFVPFFAFIFLLTMVGVSYTVHCGASCCPTPENPGGNKTPGPVSKRFLASWAAVFAAVIGLTILLPFTI